MLRQLLLNTVLQLLYLMLQCGDAPAQGLVGTCDVRAEINDACINLFAAEPKRIPQRKQNEALHTALLHEAHSEKQANIAPQRLTPRCPQKV